MQTDEHRKPVFSKTKEYHRFPERSNSEKEDNVLMLSSWGGAAVEVWASLSSVSKSIPGIL